MEAYKYYLKTMTGKKKLVAFGNIYTLISKLGNNNYIHFVLLVLDHLEHMLRGMFCKHENENIKSRKLILLM